MWCQGGFWGAVGRVGACSRVGGFVVDGEVFWGDDVMDMMIEYLDDPGIFARDELGRLADLPVAAQRKESRL